MLTDILEIMIVLLIVAPLWLWYIEIMVEQFHTIKPNRRQQCNEQK